MAENETRPRALQHSAIELPTYTIEVIRKPNGRGGFLMVSYKVAAVGTDPAQLIQNINTLARQLEGAQRAPVS